MKDDSFLKYVEGQLSELPDVFSKRMFGGWGLYARDKFFGIISNESLYFKTNKETRKKYIDRGSDCFRPYLRQAGKQKKKQVLKNYYEVPLEILENPSELSEWASESAELN